MRILLRRRPLWLAVNAMGLGAFLFAASGFWVRPGEEGLPVGPADGFIWLFTVAPILGVFAIFNVCALVAIARRRASTPIRAAFALWVIVAVLWAGALVVDHWRSVRYVDAAYV